MSPAQFENYKPTTILGASLTITAPPPANTTQLRFSIWVPTAGFSSLNSRSPPSIRTPAEVAVRRLRQQLLLHRQHRIPWKPKSSGNSLFPGSKGTSAIPFNDSTWASFDTRYYLFAAQRSLNGADQDNGQQNFSLGSEINVSINNRNSLLFEFADALLHRNGPAIVGFGVKYDYAWGKGYK